jgi:hypothetical protein
MFTLYAEAKKIFISTFLRIGSQKIFLLKKIIFLIISKKRLCVIYVNYFFKQFHLIFFFIGHRRGNIEMFDFRPISTG